MVGDDDNDGDDGAGGVEPFFLSSPLPLPP